MEFLARDVDMGIFQRLWRQRSRRSSRSQGQGNKSSKLPKLNEDDSSEPLLKEMKTFSSAPSADTSVSPAPDSDVADDSSAHQYDIAADNTPTEQTTNGLRMMEKLAGI